MSKADVVVTPIRRSGTKTWAHLEGQEADLSFFARLFKAKVNKDSRGCHIDITPHQREVALSKGAKDSDNQ